MFPIVKERAKIKKFRVPPEFDRKTSELPTEDAVSFPRTQKTHEDLGSEREHNFAPRQACPITKLLTLAREMTFAQAIGLLVRRSVSR